MIPKKDIQRLFEQNSPREALLQICDRLQSQKSDFTWVGFYFMDHSEKMLHLGPYRGKPTDHLHIPFGKGICGQVAVSGDTYLAANVAEEDNYIACSIDVQSEIVIPIFREGQQEAVAQLDIDSDTLNAFNASDRRALEEMCRDLGEIAGAELSFAEFQKIIDHSESHQPD